MLMGEYAHTIDAKGRVILPADFRAELGEHFFIVKGLDQCLYIYGENEWASFVQKVRQLPDTKPETRRLVRHFFSSGRERECDRCRACAYSPQPRRRASLFLRGNTVAMVVL